jgi:hypothetical protein
MSSAEQVVGSMSGVTLAALIGACVRLYEGELPPIYIDEPSRLPTGTVAGVPPRSIAYLHVRSYMDRVHRWYPFLDLSRLAKALVAPHMGSLDPWERYSLFMIFALGTPVEADPFTSEEYLATAVSYIPLIARDCSVQTVRAILLLCVFGLRSYRNDGLYSVDLWQLVGFGIRMAIQLGLSRNNHKWNFSEQEKEARRRVWWWVVAPSPSRYQSPVSELKTPQVYVGDREDSGDADRACPRNTK